MKKSKSSWQVLFFCMIALAGVLFAGAEPTVVPITEKLFLFQGLDGGNVAYLVTEKGVLVVDSGTSPAEGKLIVEKIGTLTGKPIRYVVLTHYHGDHTFGLQAFPEEAVVIGHRNLALNIRKFSELEIKENIEKGIPQQIAAVQQNIEKLKKKKSKDLAKEQEKLKELEATLAAMKELKAIYPGIAYEGLLAISLGGETVELIYPGSAHTSCNTLVYFPGQKAIHMGDMLFNGSLPYIDWRAGSDTANWIDKLKEISNLQIEKVIPGHGELTDRGGLAKQELYLSDLRAEVQKAIARGDALEQIKKKITLPAWKDLKWQDLLPNNIEAVYRELKK